MSAPDCYGYIVGLYNGECPCYDFAPADYNESQSGRYLSDLFEPKFIDGLLNCDQGDSIWTLMEDVREGAVRDFIADTNAVMMKVNRLKRQPYKGAIGRAGWTKDLSLEVGRYAGVRMFCADIVSGFIKIKKIGTLFGTTGTITLSCYNNLGDLIETWTLDTTADTHDVTTITELELPLHNAYVDNLEYWFIYEIPYNPKDNNLLCNCGKWRPVFNLSNPYWHQIKSNKQYRWGDYLMAGGYYGTLPNFIDPPTTANDRTYGLTFDVELGCKVGEALCLEELDYESNTLAGAMSQAIQKKMGAMFVDKILLSQNLNREILTMREDLAGFKNEWLKGYYEMINYIAENVEVENNDCFECRDLIEMSKGRILA